MYKLNAFDYTDTSYQIKIVIGDLEGLPIDHVSQFKYYFYLINQYNIYNLFRNNCHFTQTSYLNTHDTEYLSVKYFVCYSNCYTKDRLRLKSET